MSHFTPSALAVSAVLLATTVQAAPTDAPKGADAVRSITSTIKNVVETGKIPEVPVTAKAASSGNVGKTGTMKPSSVSEEAFPDVPAR